MKTTKLRTYEQMKAEREESKNPITISGQEWIILSDGWIKEDQQQRQANK